MIYKCVSCVIEKPSSEYRVHKRGYRIKKCRPCERQYQREQSAADVELYRKRKRESMARRRAADVQGSRAYQRLWYANNSSKINEAAREQRERRFFWARGSRWSIPARELAKIWKAQRGLCALTGVRLTREAQVDHIVPQARGGSHGISNLRWVSAEANFAKRDLTDDEFFALCSSVVRWIGERIAMVSSMERDV